MSKYRKSSELQSISLSTIQPNKTAKSIGSSIFPTESKYRKRSDAEISAGTVADSSVKLKSIYDDISFARSKYNAKELTAPEYKTRVDTAMNQIEKLKNSLASADAYLSDNAQDYNDEIREYVKKQNEVIRQMQDELKSNYGYLQDAAAFDQKSGIEKFWKTIADATKAGLAVGNEGLVRLADLVIPQEYINYGDNFLQDAFDYAYKSYADFNAEAEKTKSFLGAGWKTAADILQSLVSSTPSAIMAMMSGGATAPASLASTAAMASAPTMANTVASSFHSLSNNPTFWVNALPAFGNTYAEAKEEGAGELEAITTGVLNAVAGSAIEVGGGIETLPATKAGVRAWVKTMLDEGKEEVLQGIVENLAKKYAYDYDKPYAAIGNEEAVISPERAAKEFAGGAAVGGIMGGLQMGASKAIDAISSAKKSASADAGATTPYPSPQTGVQAESAVNTETDPVKRWVKENIWSGKESDTDITGESADRWAKSDEQWTANNRNSADNEKSALRSVTEITQKIRDAFGIPISTGKFRQKAYGIYKTKAEAIRTKVSDALPTISHELGHHFDKLYGLSHLSSSSEAVSVLQETRPEFAAKYKKREIPGEAIAEFMRDYLTDRTAASKKYPAFYKEFQESIPANILKKLDAIGNDINGYMNADLSDRAAANILTRKESKNIYESKKSLRESFTNAREIFEDSAIKLMDVSKEAYDRFYMSKNIGNMTERMLIGDYMLDINGRPVQWADGTGSAGYVDSLGGILHDIKLSQRADFDLYLVYRHALEYLANDKRVFADDRLNNAAFIRKEISRMEKEFPSFRDTAESVYQWQKIFMQKWLVETGLMTQDTYNLLTEKYPNYVPFQRSIDSGKKGGKNSTANQTLPIMRAKGSGRAILSPVESIPVTAYKYTAAADRNAVMLEVAKATRSTDGLGHLIEEVPASKMKKAMSTDSIRDRIADILSGSDIDDDVAAAIDEAIGQEISQWVVNPKQGENIVWMIENGEKKYFQVHDKGLLSALTGMSRYQANGFFSALGAASRVFKTLNTGTNPIFALTNAIRDYQTTWIYGSENNPIKFFGQYIKAIADVASGLRGKDGAYKNWLDAGGGYTSPISNPKQLKSVTENMYKNDRGALKKIFEGPVRILEAIETFSNITESAPRLAEYKRQIKRGAEPRRAALESDEVSVNFKRKGQISPQLDAIYPYSNAAVQGISKMLKFAKDNPKSFFTKTIVTNAVLAAIVIGWNRLMNDEEEYSKLSNYMKNNYYCFSTGGGEFIRIPKARELSAFESLIERTYEIAASDNDHSFDGFIDYMAQQFLPPGFPTPDNPYAPLSDMVIIGTGMDLAANKNFSGSPIVPAQYQKLQPSAQYDDKTSFIAKWLGDFLGLSPMQIDYVINDNLGIAGNLNKAIGPNDKDGTLGIVNRFTADNAYSSDVLNRFYDAADEYELKANTYPDNGEAVGIHKQYQSVMSVISQINKYARESAVDGRDIKIAARDYAEHFQNENAGKIDERLIELYERTGSASVFPYKTFSSSISIDGETVRLSQETFMDYVDEYGKEIQGIFDNVLKSDAPDEHMVKMLEKAKRDLSSALAEKYCGKTSELEGGLFNARKAGIPDAVYLEYEARTSNLKADKKANGDAIAGSLKRKKEEVLKEMGVPEEQKNVLLILDGYGNDRQRERILGDTANSSSSWKTDIDTIWGMVIGNGK